ncbi:DUF262 domain-containing protein [Flavobacterium procerum]|uniref:DUF262 domain-containing protein n=1 Tax=Flavobacterium procerum TaxID=1455569 RepID=A0ABV6BPL8_9FLAO
MNNSIEVSSISLMELLQYNLKIPEYQRPYVWTKYNINKLIHQISEHNNRKDDKPNFYLGSIVLHKDDDGYNIIDGQQRITTMQILEKIKSNVDFNVTYSHPITFKHIKENFDHYNSNQGTIENLELNFSKLNVTLVITNSEDMAYNFFETLNTGGIRLGGTDILKAHHLRSVKEKDERNSFAKEWESKQKNLETVNRMLSLIRRMDYLNRHKNLPDKNTDISGWKNILTTDFAEKVKKENRDIGYSFVEIEENTHKITADKYAIRQPLNEGVNYINYLLSFTDDYNFLFLEENQKGKYAEFNSKIINIIDGTIDLRSYYKLALLSFVDRFGRKNVLEFSLYLFRFIYSLRLSDKSRIYEATVRNFIDETKILDRILNAFTYEEVLFYLKKQKLPIQTKDLTGVRERFFYRVNAFFNEPISKENFDSDLKKAIENYLKND